MAASSGAFCFSQIRRAIFRGRPSYLTLSPCCRAETCRSLCRANSAKPARACQTTPVSVSYAHHQLCSVDQAAWLPCRHLTKPAGKAALLEETKEERKPNFGDCFIPLTRRTLIQRLMEREKFLNEEERKGLEKFSWTLDAALLTKLDSDLTSLKSLFDSINPDKDTAEAHKYSRRERLDNEFWCLQKLSTVLEQANFNELPSSVVTGALSEHKVDGVLVCALPDQYDVVRYWALGHSTLRSRRAAEVGRDWLRPMSLTGKHKYYKRVIVAVRPKTDDRLQLKAFKEIPVDRLEQLLPVGTIRMSMLDQYTLMAAASLTLGCALGKLFANWLGVAMNLPIATVAASSMGTAAYVWTSYKNKQQRRLIEANLTLYFKNIINNRGLLAVIANKARDEVFKECLLTYVFLLAASRTPSGKQGGALTQSQLDHNVSDWLEVVTTIPVQFNSSASLRLLDSLGLIARGEGGLLAAPPLDLALRQLPPCPTGAGTAGFGLDEYDLVEGFEVERSIFEEHEDDYTLADKIKRTLGWR